MNSDPESQPAADDELQQLMEQFWQLPPKKKEQFLAALSDFQTVEENQPALPKNLRSLLKGNALNRKD